MRLVQAEESELEPVLLATYRYVSREELHRILDAASVLNQGVVVHSQPKILNEYHPRYTVELWTQPQMPETPQEAADG